MYYFGARYYDPIIGRFITRDPVKGNHMNPQSLNPYVYCLNNPMKYIDPDGRYIDLGWLWEVIKTLIAERGADIVYFLSNFIPYENKQIRPPLKSDSKFYGGTDEETQESIKDAESTDEKSQYDFSPDEQSAEQTQEPSGQDDEDSEDTGGGGDHDWIPI